MPVVTLPESLNKAALAQLIEILAPHPTRLVGGVVRDALLGHGATDIDLATTCPPEEAQDRLQCAGIQVIPTGIEHGTITAIIDTQAYEITTLREDVSTDGRHATVSYTNDFETDASRRDFTFNALYADLDGTLYDYFNGVADLEAGHVRFIGDPAVRIAEDALRILRFFRFYARFGNFPPDDATRSALHAQSGLLARLSAERITAEWLKIMAEPDPIAALELCTALKIHRALGLKHLHTVALAQHVKLFPARRDPLERLAVLVWPQDVQVLTANNRFCWSTKQAAALRLLLKPAHTDLAENLPPLQAAYTFGPAQYAALLAILAAHQSTPAPNKSQAVAEAAALQPPAFPITGHDALEAGVPQGAALGKALRHVEAWWLQKNFPDRTACLAELRAYLKSR